MKTAEEWAKQIGFNDGLPLLELEVIRAIQQDAVPQWRDIESAPQYKEVLIHVMGNTYCAIWSERNSDDKEAWFDVCDYKVVCEVGQPTHWQALPPAPNPPSAGGGE